MAQLTRVIAALAVLAAGAVHLYLYGAQDYRTIHVIGPLFLLNGIAAAGIGLALLVSANAFVVLSGIVYSGATLIAFVISATSGLFGWNETWSGTAQAVAGFTELGALVLLLGLLVARGCADFPRGGGVAPHAAKQRPWRAAARSARSVLACPRASGRSRARESRVLTSIPS